MRLDETLVLQQVDDTHLVLVDDQTGQEHVFELTKEVINDLMQPDSKAGRTIGGITVPGPTISMFSFALGYFWAGMNRL